MNNSSSSAQLNSQGPLRANTRAVLTWSALLFLTASGIGATTVYLPAPGPLSFLPVTGATNASPIVITSNSHGLSNGAAVWCQNIGGNLAANGYFSISGVTTNTFQLTYLYFGGNAAGNGTYSGGGSCTPLAGFSLTDHPRVWLDGQSGPLYTSLSNPNTKASATNPPWAAINNVYSSFTSIYTTPQVDSGGGSVSTPWWFNRFAAACFVWNANRDTTSATICDYGIGHIEQILGQHNNFYCDTSGSQCGNRNNSADMDYGSFSFVPMYVAFSLYHNQLTTAEIQAFANKMLNDNDINHNGIGMPGSPSTGCANNDHTPWQPGDCGITYLLKHLSYAPVMVPGQESHYTSDYGSNTQAGVWDLPPHNSNLTMAQLYGDIMRAVALADDDPRARMLLTQAYSYWYKWYWAYATSTWTGMNQLGARYSLYRGFPWTTEIALIMKNSCGLDITAGNYLTRQLPYVLYMTLPDNPNGQLDVYGDIYTSADNPQDAYTAVAASEYEYQSDQHAPYVQYWINNTIGEYNATWMGNSTQLQYAFGPYVFVDPSYTQSNTKSLPSQFVFKDTDYNACVAAFGSALGNCYPNQVYGAAVSKSSWTSTATQVVVQSMANNDNQDHSGCGTFGSYHIYKQSYLLAGNGASNGARYANGEARGDCGTGMPSDNVIVLGGADNWLGSAPAFISRWGGTDPSGDAQSRYTYLLADVTGSYNSTVKPSRVQRHIVHFKKATTQDYIVSYDDVATASATQMQAYWNYFRNGNNGSNTISASSLGVTNTAANSRLASTFLGVGGSIAMVASGTAGAGNVQQFYTCPSSSGSACNISTTAFEEVAVHLPSLSTTASMPPISQPACSGTGGNCAVVDIQDGGSPKVAVFARQGALLTAASFTSTHAGAAQYLIAGLAPGGYQVNLNGVAIAGSPFTAAAGDNTLYFEGSSGTYAITQSGSGGQPPAVASFTATPNPINAGRSAMLAWSVSGNPAPNLSISPGVGAVNGSSVSVSPSTTTTYTLTATNSAGSASATSTVTVTPDTTPPSVPTNLSATSVSTSQIDLSWTASTDNVGVAGYRIYRNGAQTGTTSGTSYSDVGLSPATKYTYTVAAYDAAGNVSAQSTSASATTGSAQSPVITSFTATSKSIIAGQATTLSWTVTGNPSPSLSVSNGVGSVTGLTSISVSPAATTMYTLTATNSAGSASANVTISVAPDTTPPSVPSSVAATAETSSAINISWVASTDNVGVAGYRIYRNSAQIATAGTTSFADSGLAPSTTYKYTVAAYDAAGNVSAQSAPASATTLSGTSLGGCPVFPANNVWNTPVNNLPVDANSSAYINTIGSSTPLHPDFSASGGGIPYNIVPASQPLVTVNFADNSQGDPGPYPIPANAQVESGSDHHVLVVDQGNCKLYELWLASLNSDGITWSANNGAVFDLNSDILRPSGWTSADGAGLPILPGLIRYDETMSGQINHAIRLTAPQTRNQFLWPARHYASSLSGQQYPPMGQRFRLKASFDVTPYPFEVQVILNALKTYGAILADNGSSWYLTGAPDPRWNDSNLHTISQVVGNNMEAVNESSLEVESNSGAVTGSTLALAGIYLDQREVRAANAVNAEAILTAPAPSGGAMVAISSSDSQAVSAPSSVTIPAGAMSAPVPITINSITQTTPVVLSPMYKSVTSPSPVLLVDGTSGKTAPLLSAMSLSPTTIGGTNVTGNVTLTSAAPSGGTTVALSSSNTSAASVPSSVKVAAGVLTSPFVVTTYNQTANASATIDGSLNGESLGIQITVTPGSSDSLTSLTVVPATAPGGSNLTGTVTLSGPAPSGGIVVALSSSNTSAATVPSTVTVPASSNTATFTVSTHTQISNATANISATLGGTTKQVSITVTAPVIVAGLTVSPTTAVGGTNLTGTITLSGPAPAGGTVVTLSSSNRAVATVPGSITIVSGAITGTFTVTTLPQSSNGTATITASANGTSQTATVTVTPPAVPPFITQQPVGATACANTTVTFTAAAGGSPVPTVQWQESLNQGSTWQNINGTSSTLTFQALSARNGTQFHAVFTNTGGQATTHSAMLIVNTAPSVTTNPKSQTVSRGTPVTFSAAASGTPTPSVQWQLRTNAGGTWSNIAGATSTTLTFAAQPSQNGYQYRGVFSGACGTALTTSATLTVK